MIIIFQFRILIVSAMMLLLSCQETDNDGDQGDIDDVVAVSVETLVDEIDGGSGGIAIDRDGNVYSADFGSRLSGPGSVGGDKVFKITPDGTVSLFADGFRGASGNAFDSQGNLFQSNIGGNFISKITPDGDVSVFSREGVRNPVGIAIDQDDTLFVCNCGSGSIQKITKDGKSSSFVKSPLLRCPNGIVRDDEGNLYAANFYNGNVLKITPDATVVVLATVPGNNNGHLVFFRGKLFVVGRSAHQIYQVTLDGEVSPDGRFMYVNEVAPIKGDGKILAPTRVRRIVIEE